MVLDRIVDIDPLYHKEYIILETGVYADGSACNIQIQCKGFVDDILYLASGNFDEESVERRIGCGSLEQWLDVYSKEIEVRGFLRVEEFTCHRGEQPASSHTGRSYSTCKPNT